MKSETEMKAGDGTKHKGKIIYHWNRGGRSGDSHQEFVGTGIMLDRKEMEDKGYKDEYLDIGIKVIEQTEISNTVDFRMPFYKKNIHYGEYVIPRFHGDVARISKETYDEILRREKVKKVKKKHIKAKKKEEALDRLKILFDDDEADAGYHQACENAGIPSFLR